MITSDGTLASALPEPLDSRTQKVGIHKLSSTAKEFEAILLTQWLQSAEDSFGTVPGSGSEEDSSSEQLRSLGVQHLAKSLSDSGGIGLGAMVLKALKRADEKGAAASGSMDHIQTHSTGDAAFGVLNGPQLPLTTKRPS